jgi:hypothetical protein
MNEYYAAPQTVPYPAVTYPPAAYPQIAYPPAAGGYPAAGQHPQWAGREPVFQVRLMKHTGMAIMFLNQQYTVTGTFAQCDAAIRQAQNHNLTAGWWSVLSLAVMNWVALGTNASARHTLRKQAIAAFGVDPRKLAR